jgi:hypothetical protein
VDEVERAVDQLGPTAEELGRVIETARGGDPEALARLRAYLDTYPELGRALGDLAGLVERSWLGLVVGSDAALEEATTRRLAALKSELAGPGAPPLDRLLAERVAACWLQVQAADAAAAGAMESGPGREAQALRRQQAAHRRYLTAMATLATVQRLLPRPGPADAEPGPTDPAIAAGSPPTTAAGRALPPSAPQPPGPCLPLDRTGAGGHPRGRSARHAPPSRPEGSGPSGSPD